MATLNTDIRYIKGVGEARAKSLAKLGITDLRSLLSYFPRAYDDRRAYKKIADLIPGENACVCAVIAGEPRLSRIRKGLDLIKLRAVAPVPVNVRRKGLMRHQVAVVVLPVCVCPVRRAVSLRTGQHP